MNFESLPFVGLLSILGVCFVVALVRSLRRVITWGLSAGDATGKIDPAEACYLALVLVIAVAVLSVPPFAASNLAISDSVEYAVGAERAVDLGQFNLAIEGREYPSRYGPWFSLFVLAPAYIAGGKDIGLMIIPVTILALFGVIAVYCIARRISSVWGGMVAAFALLLDPGYRYFSTFPMTDVPSAALLLVIVAAALALHNNLKRDSSCWLELGLLGGMLSSWRPASLVVVLPLLWLCLRAPGPDRKFARLVLCFSPLAIFVLMQLGYNMATFGSPWRNGYHFWLPWPYQFPEVVFSLRYLGENLNVLLSHTAAPIFAVVVLASLPLMKPDTVSLRMQQKNFQRLMLCIALVGVPMLGIYLFYFYAASRFYLPLAGLLYAAIGATIGGFLGALDRQRMVTLLVLVVIAAASVGWRTSKQFHDSTRRYAVDYLRQHTPSDSLIISGLDPVYVEPFVLRGSKRVFLPYSRRIEFASKVVAWNELEFSPPYPTNPHEVPRGYVLGSGGKDVVSWVAVDDHQVIHQALEAGRPVFFETSSLDQADIDAFTHRFVVKEVAPALYAVVSPWHEHKAS